MKRLAFLTAAILVLALGAVVVIANQDAQSAVGTTGQYSAPATNQVATEGGNVTENNVSSIATTANWQGFYGNISGSLRLGDGTDVFYDWTGITFAAVYASPDNAVTWGGLTGVNDTSEKETKDTEFGFTSANADSINQTISGTACTAGTEIANAGGVFSFNDVGGNSVWQTCVAEDAAGLANTVLGTDIQSGTGYDANTWDYQLMVPVDATGRLYYFYLEA